MTNPQATRYTMVVACSFILAYDICVRSVGGSINEAVAIISSIIGIIRYRKGAKKIRENRGAEPNPQDVRQEE